jgi:serine/threonine protein kinase
VGTLGGTLSAQGLDRRLLVREFTGKLALSLARAELESLSRLQSDVMTKVDDQCRDGTWIPTAASRSVKLREDNANVAKLLKTLASTSTSTSNEQSVPFLGILGEVDLTDILEDMSPNEFYRALGVPPPNADAVWLVYEYAGLSTVQAYAVPPIIRRANLPMRKGLFGNVIEPPPLPPWKERARYVRAIMKGAILAVAQMHESGIVHRSIGRTSIIISTKAMDKREAISPLNTMTSTLRIKLADFGFSGLLTESTQNEEFCTRARSFGLRFRKGDNNISTANFAIAEDMHALGFVFLGLLLTSLAELPDAKYQIPATDEDSLQRLVGEIFDNEFVEFREYVDAEDIWSNLVEWLDENDKAGWRVLETLLLAREKAGKNQDTTQLFTVRGLLANPFFRS